MIISRSELLARFVDLVILNEGGMVTAQEAAERGDPGGATNWGVTQRTLDGLRRLPKWRHMPERVDDLTRAQAEEIYREEYWCARGIDGLAARPGIAVAVADAGVQHGPKQAVLFLQALLPRSGPSDGVVGPLTILRASEAHHRLLLVDYHARRRRFVLDWVRRDQRRAGIVGGLIARIDRTERVAMGLADSFVRPEGREVTLGGP